MQRLFFEKQIDLNHALQELISVSVNENLAYQDDPEGKRAVGTLEISGDYLRMASRDRFNDQIEIDVLAPFDRLEDDEDFHLEVQDFDYHIQNGNLNLEIQVLAHGVGEKKERHIVVDAPDDNEQAILQEIQNIVSSAELAQSIEEELKEHAQTQPTEVPESEDEEPAVSENDDIRDDEAASETAKISTSEEITDSAEEVSESEASTPEIIRDEAETAESEIIENDLPTEMPDVAETKLSIETRPQDILEAGNEEALESEWQDSESIDVEDLFDDSVMAFVTYPIYVVQSGDSYERIAERYQIDAETLMDYNQHVSLKPHQLLVIPPR